MAIQEADHEGEVRTVCVTGAAGFIGSWTVKYLLERGYKVRGSVRDPGDESKVEHLKHLKGAKERLRLVRADLLDYESLVDAVSGCQVVIHTACPCPEASTFRISDPHSELIHPSVTGTLNVLQAAHAARVKTVVMTSSVGAMYLHPDRPLDEHQPLDESCWSDVDYLAKINEWYCLAKTLAEQSAWKFVEDKPEMRLLVINPAVVMGPLLQSKLNASSTHILKYLTGAVRSYANRCQAYVDVRDVAMAHIVAVEKPDAHGRYFLAESSVHRGELVEMLADMYPEYTLPLLCSDTSNPRATPYKFSNAKAQQLLGGELISLRKCLHDSVESLQDKGFLAIAQGKMLGS